jgi:hypothetical protein
MFKVLKDWKGSPDGFTVIEYKEGEIVDLHPTLVDVALGEKWVERDGLDGSTYAMALEGWVGESPPVFEPLPEIVGSKPVSETRVSRRKRKKG